MNDKNTITRRQVVAGLGTGLAAAIATPSFAGGIAGNGSFTTAGASELEDPTTKFPKPPFKEQSQPWPGLAGKMEPKPDHGEKSYKG